MNGGWILCSSVDLLDLVIGCKASVALILAAAQSNIVLVFIVKLNKIRPQTENQKLKTALR